MRTRRAAVSRVPGAAVPEGPTLRARALAAFISVGRRESRSTIDLDVARTRKDVEFLARVFKPVARIRSEPVDAAGVPAEWIAPDGVSTEGVVLYLHGGSFISGSIVSHRTLAGNVAIASGARTLLIDYRLAPEHPFPEGLEDAATAYQWILAQGIEPASVVVAGDSAGGNLSLSLLVLLRDTGRPLPAAAVCLSPNPDLTYSSESWVTNANLDVMISEHLERQAVDVYLRGADPRSPRASPSFADLRGLPPMFLQVGSFEVLRSDVEGFAERARRAGVAVTLEVWPGMQHEWQFAAKILPEGRAAVARIGAFVKAALSRRAAALPLQRYQ
jgi:monoterpene epsilon-lactone hydrolase